MYLSIKTRKTTRKSLFVKYTLCTLDRVSARTTFFMSEPVKLSAAYTGPLGNNTCVSCCLPSFGKQHVGKLLPACHTCRWGLFPATSTCKLSAAEIFLSLPTFLRDWTLRNSSKVLKIFLKKFLWISAIILQHYQLFNIK